jgi:hypothetical protein
MHEISREAAKITINKVKKFEELNAPNKEEGEKKFLEKTRELWREFAVHGRLDVDKKTGQKTILNFSDLDGKTTLGLLKLAGLDTKDVKYVAPGDYISGRINLDTGNRHGLVLEGEGTVFFDHHGKESESNLSATAVTYEILTSLGLLEKKEYLDKMVQFVTQVDNRVYPDEEKYFKEGYRTVLGLQRFMQFKHLLDYFKAGRVPTDPLSDEDLSKMGLILKSNEQKKAIEESWKALQEMEKNGLIVDSEKYGEIAIDNGKKVIAGFDAIKAFGCGAYIIWSPKDDSFFVSSTTKLSDEFSQGRKVRESMWIKPRQDKIPLTIKLGDILNKMTDGKLKASGELLKILEKEKQI